MAEDQEIDSWIESLTGVPANELNSSARRWLIEFLTPRVQDMTPTGITKDWEGLAELMGFKYQTIQYLESLPNPVQHLLDMWTRQRGATIDVLMKFLLQMKRYDLLEEEMFRGSVNRDVGHYRARNGGSNPGEEQRPIQVPHVASSSPSWAPFSGSAPYQPMMPYPSMSPHMQPPNYMHLYNPMQPQYPNVPPAYHNLPVPFYPPNQLGQHQGLQLNPHQGQNPSSVPGASPNQSLGQNWNIPRAADPAQPPWSNSQQNHSLENNWSHPRPVDPTPPPQPSSQQNPASLEYRQLPMTSGQSAVAQSSDDSCNLPRSREWAPPPPPSTSTSSFPSTDESINIDETKNITIQGDDFIYDAFVSYAKEDWWFVQELINNLEKENNNITLCLDIRDLLVGGSHNTVTAELIENRCKRVLLVISPNFIKSPICDFHFKFTQSLSPGARGKKMIPIVIAETQNLSPLLRHVTMLHFTTCGDPRWFWDRLEHSVRADIVMIGEQDMAALREITCDVSQMAVPSCLLNRMNRPSRVQPRMMIAESSASCQLLSSTSDGTSSSQEMHQEQSSQSTMSAQGMVQETSCSSSSAESHSESQQTAHPMCQETSPSMSSTSEMPSQSIEKAEEAISAISRNSSWPQIGLNFTTENFFGISTPSVSMETDSGSLERVDSSESSKPQKNSKFFRNPFKKKSKPDRSEDQ